LCSHWGEQLSSCEVVAVVGIDIVVDSGVTGVVGIGVAVGVAVVARTQKEWERARTHQKLVLEILQLEFWLEVGEK